MSTVDVRHGDCLDVMRELPDCSVDSVVTDPPYGLANTTAAQVAETITHWVSGDRTYIPEGRGFMGKSWDAFVPPAAVWDECLRVLKPGGHLLAFAGTRTMDLMTLGIRLAGFEVRDSIAWLYGCHDDQTEVLTERGWVRGVDVEVGDVVAQWDRVTEAVTLVPIERKYLAPWNGEMVKFTNRDTDQLVTPNHRMPVKIAKRIRNGQKYVATVWPDGWDVRDAAEIPRGAPLRLPLGGQHTGTGIGGDDYAALLGWVWTEGGFDKAPSTGVRIYQSMTNALDVKQIDALLERLDVPHKRYERTRTYAYVSGEREYVEVCWFFTGSWAQRVRADLPDKHPTWKLLWRMTLAEKLALWEAAMDGDGTRKNGQETFFQKSADDLEWFQALTSLSGRSGGVVQMRSAPRTGGQVGVRQRASTELQTATLRNKSEHYTGFVWCVGVPVGGFIARRSGRVFASMNSGFPKSLDVSKAIDKEAGAEREVVGPGRWNHVKGTSDQSGALIRPGTKHDETAPATEAAQQWQGWGTALKPAFEGVVCAVKPDSEQARIGSRLADLEDQCRRFVRGAEQSSRPIPHGSPEGRTATAPVSAAILPEDESVRRTSTGGVGGSSDQTDTSWSASAAEMCSNIVTSWKRCWDELLQLMSTSTTSTTFATTIDLKTLWSSLSRITGASTHLTDPTNPDGLSSPARIVDSLFAAALLTLRATRELTATEPVTSPTHTTCPREAASPAFEPIVVARKPLVGTVAVNVLAHGTGALNIEGCRIGTDERVNSPSGAPGANAYRFTGGDGRDAENARAYAERSKAFPPTTVSGRWPANVCLDEDQAAALDQQSGKLSSGGPASRPSGHYDRGGGESWLGTRTADGGIVAYQDSGGASRFFYCAKAPKSERLVVDGVAHPTVKPLALMRWLVRLVTPPGGTVLDPFAGSGTTVEAAMLEGFRVVGIEREAEYLPHIQQRIFRAQAKIAELAAIPEPVQLDLFGDDNAA